MNRGCKRNIPTAVNKVVQLSLYLESIFICHNIYFLDLRINSEILSFKKMVVQWTNNVLEHKQNSVLQIETESKKLGQKL